MGDQGATALADSLKTNSCLTALHLVSEGSSGWRAVGVFKIMDRIAFITYLQDHFFLHHCVSFSFLERILCRLIFNLLLGFHIGLFFTECRVTHALQWRNHVGDQGATALADSLKTNSFLTELFLVSEVS